jgi:hypothetical protein
MRERLVKLVLASVLFVVIEWVGAASGQQAFAMLSANSTASRDCAATFEIASEKVNGFPVNPHPWGKLQIWIDGRYTYVDATADTSEPRNDWRYTYESARYMFRDGPLARWNSGQSGSEGRSIRFRFHGQYGDVEIVMQESFGCSPWPSCSKCR